MGGGKICNNRRYIKTEGEKGASWVGEKTNGLVMKKNEKKGPLFIPNKKRGEGKKEKKIFQKSGGGGKKKSNLPS